MTDKSDPLLSQWGKPKNLRVTTAESSLHGGDYTWPNIFDEANEMLFASILIYALADLRTLARRGLLVMAEDECEEEEEDEDEDEDEDENDHPAETHKQKKDGSISTDLVQQILTLPFSTKEIVRLVSKNRGTLVEEFGESATELYLSAFDLLETATSPNTTSTTTYVTATDSFDHCSNHHPKERGAPLPPPPPSSEVVVCDDENKTEELVYGIWICSARRRITVTFRGCKTMTDWSTSVNQYLKTLPNPVASSATCGSSSSPSSWPTKKEVVPDSIGLHYGFYSYLNFPTRSGETKREAILGHLQRLFQQYPGYRLYVTGHSLGGALATIFAFQTAAESTLMETMNIPSPITCFNFASPMVGNLAFKKTFNVLERRGKIRCLRVTNSLDIVTRLPDRGSSGYLLPVCLPHGPIEYVGVSCLFFMCVQNHIYRHVGMNLKLYRHGNYKIKFPKESDNPLLLAAQDWKTHLARPIQMIMTLPFACCGPCLDYAWCCHIEDFGVNHQARAYRDRLQPLRNEFHDKYLNDLYDDPNW